MDELRKNLVERLGLAEDRADAAIKEVLAYLIEHLPAPAADVVADFAASPEDTDEERTKKITTATVAATTAAVNAVVLPGAQSDRDLDSHAALRHRRGRGETGDRSDPVSYGRTDGTCRGARYGRSRLAAVS